MLKLSIKQHGTLKQADYNMDLENTVQQHEVTINNLSEDLQSLSDSFERYASDNEQKIQELQDKEQTGLQFPLSQETVDLIKEVFPTGKATLSSGTVTVSDSRVSPSSVIMLTVSSPSGTRGFISYTASAGSFVINSSSGTETSIISYVIYN